MRFKWTLLLLPAFITGCFHSGTQRPQGYCHQLRTELNTRSNSLRNQSKTNPANRAVLLHQYQTLDCEQAP